MIHATPNVWKMYQLEKKRQFRVLNFDVDKGTKLSEFLQQKLNKFDDDYTKVLVIIDYYEFKAKMDLFSYREVMEVTVSNSKVFYVKFG